MLNSEYIKSQICKLYDLYKENPNLEVSCFVETSKFHYTGTLVFDDLLIVPQNSLILKGVGIFDKSETLISSYEESTISLDSIAAFSYKVSNID